jgi:hypothetical protein
MMTTPGSPRITIVSSGMHYWVNQVEEVKSKHMLNKLNDPTGMNSAKLTERYNVTKRKSLFQVIFLWTETIQYSTFYFPEVLLHA